MTEARPTMIVELDGTGHRFYLVRLLVEEALAQGREVVLLTVSGPVVAKYREPLLGSLVERVRLVEVPERSWRVVEQTAREVGPEVTVLSECDWCIAHLATRGGWHGPGRLRMLLMRDYPSTDQNPLVFLAKLVVKVAAMVACTLLPRIRFFVLRSPLWRGRSVWRDVRDPVGLERTPGDVDRVRRDLGMTDDRYWFGIIGMINTSKNVPTVADALCRLCSSAPAHERPYGLVLAGHIADQMRQDVDAAVQRLKEAGIEVVLADRFLGREEFDAMIGAVDCFVVAYSRDAPSGTFVKAVASGCRVVAAGAKTLRDDAATVPGVASWTELEPAALAEALAAASRLPRPTPVPLAGEAEFARRLLG
ncbi:MAG: hypothetical protein ACRDPH_01470 [Marmoricola sp.]